MTIEAFAELLFSIDPNAVRNEKIGQKGDAYTVFSDYSTSILYANGRPAGFLHKIQVDYFTRTEDDPVAFRFLRTFAENDEITCDYQKDFETDSRYFHHIFDCEVVADYGAV